MGAKTGISWTDSTWNPATGCTRVSPGCDHCYAETLTERFRNTQGHYFEQGFDVVLRPDKLDLPLRWPGPRKVFVNSMSDLFHEQIPDEYIARVFAVMAAAPRLTFQVLTKRHGRMRSLLAGAKVNGFLDAMGAAMLQHTPTRGGVQWPLPNVWLGVSVEDQKWADIRIPALVETPAAVRFLSCEPLVGPVNLGAWPYLDEQEDGYRPIDWVIVGGESGRGARLMEADWARSLHDQCIAAGIPFFFKQAGTVLAKEWGATGKGEDPAEWPEPFPQHFPTI